MNPKIALLSVSNKTGLAELAASLVAAGYTLISTGGTASALRAAGLPVTDVSAYTGHPEIMDGRVKTLHPKVAGGILGLDIHADEAVAHGISWIDVVVVNLYPFEATIARPDVSLAVAIENIDIGGPTMIRAAAKNHQRVVVVTDPADYPAVAAALAAGGASPELRARLAVKAFRHTARYDAVISGYLADTLPIPAEEAVFPGEGALPIRKVAGLRYGENPHQRAVFYADPLATGRALGRARQIQGKELSFNNLADLDATLRVAFDPALATAQGGAFWASCAIVKHHNPCGAAVHPDGPAAAFALALSADPVSAYGGVLAFNRPLTGEDVRAIRKTRVFFEVLAAPGFDPEAVSLLAARENLRVLDLPSDWQASQPSGTDARRVMGGWLLQDWDLGDPRGPETWEQRSARAPTEDERQVLRFAWAASQHVKSNAIVLACAADGGFVLNGVGAGQMSRVDSVRLAISRATRPVPGCALASDAFFPFPDGVEIALAAGVRALVQPGGSIRDEEIVQAVDGAAAAMLFTGTRHFRH